jgi:DNA ligase-1
MAPKANSLASGMESLFKKREPKAAPAAKAAESSPAKAADNLTTPDTKQQKPQTAAAAAVVTPDAVKRRKLDESGAAAAGGGPSVKATPAPMETSTLSLDSGPISLWTGSSKDDSALLSPAFDPALRASEFVIGKPLGFSLLSAALSDIEAQKGSGTGSRKRSTIVLANFFRCVLYFSPEDLVPAIYFVSNKVAPDYEESELGIGDATLIGAMGECFGRSQAQIKSDLVAGEAKDLGEVALASRAAQKMLGMPPKLLIEKVFAEMKAIATAHGKDCGKLKKDKIKKMLVSCRAVEAKYIVRMLQSKMRIGINVPTLLEALAYSFVLTKPSWKGAAPVGDIRKAGKAPSLEALNEEMQSMLEAVKQAFCEVPNFSLVTDALFAGHTSKTLSEACHISLGIPVKPMLAKPSKGIPEVVQRLSGKRFTAEWKYDGERAQIHILDRDNIRVYSRNSENMTEKYPDVIQVVKDALTDDCHSGIIDSEVVAWDLTNSRILPFQILSTRGRKGIKIEDIKVQVCIMPFDCMLHNGEPVVQRDLETRRKTLKTMLKEVPGKVTYAVGRDFDELIEEDVQAFLDESIAGSCEGLMLKTLVDNAAYMPSKRSLNWLKLKKDYIDGVGDSIDVVPIGAFYGKGKRHGAYGAFLLAIWNQEEEEFQTVCKAGTGFSDEDLKTHYEFFKDRTIPKPEATYNVDAKMTPDVWLEPVQVWEIKAADLSISPVHTSAMGVKADGKGIGLRFPRFLRIRDDKEPEDATSSEQIVDMYQSQASVGGGDDDDF